MTSLPHLGYFISMFLPVLLRSQRSFYRCLRPPWCTRESRAERAHTARLSCSTSSEVSHHLSPLCNRTHFLWILMKLVEMNKDFNDPSLGLFVARIPRENGTHYISIIIQLLLSLPISAENQPWEPATLTRRLMMRPTVQLGGARKERFRYAWQFKDNQSQGYLY